MNWEDVSFGYTNKSKPEMQQSEEDRVWPFLPRIKECPKLLLGTKPPLSEAFPSLGSLGAPTPTAIEQKSPEFVLRIIHTQV